MGSVMMDHKNVMYCQSCSCIWTMSIFVPILRLCADAHWEESRNVRLVHVVVFTVRKLFCFGSNLQVSRSVVSVNSVIEVRCVK